MLRAAKWVGRSIIAGITAYLCLIFTFFFLVWGLPRLKMRADNAP